MEPRPLTSVEALALSSGAVTKPETYNYRTMLPERAGLCSEEVFGHANLRVRQDVGHGVERRVIRLDADDRKERWGHVELEIAIQHPLVRQPLTHVMIVPPYYRRF